MAVLGGELGFVKDVGTVRNWSISDTGVATPGWASNTKRGPRRVAANKDWSGQFQVYGGGHILLPGVGIPFHGSFDGAKGLGGNIIPNRVSIEIPVENAGIITQTVSFDGDGPWALETKEVTDETLPDIYPGAVCKASLGTVAAEITWTDISNIRRMVIELTATNAAYVDSSTSQWTYRKGGPMDAAATIDLNAVDNVLANIPNTGTIRAARIYVSATTFWEFRWMHLQGLSNLTVDRESHAIVGASLGMGFSGWEEINGTPTEGVIIAPSTDTVWPEA